jgi:predicted signal transduction protein with EAL and GGDEF domain
MGLRTGVPDEAAAEPLAARLWELVTAPYVTDDGLKQVGVSIGVTLAVRGARDFEPDLRGRADAAMYEAKDAGGGVRFRGESTPG